MPELPEVEIVTRQLKEKLQGKTIVSMDVKDSKLIDYRIESILPTTIKDVVRRGKFIIFHLDANNFVLAHLRMTGHFHHITDSNETKHQKFLGGVFNLQEGDFFTYNSIRRFGSVQLYNKKELDRYLSRFGPEPSEINAAEFVAKISRNPKSVIKTKLLDQQFILGVGNIYALEALYHAGIMPTRKVGEIPHQKLATLHQELVRILDLAIEHNGSSVNNYMHIDGKGDFQNLLSVYNQFVCPKGHEVLKMQLAGRGTYYCNNCQG